ncbi:MAG TPA: substrate-binding domain-containing protein, partial [Dongiaceae bacterium]
LQHRADIAITPMPPPGFLGEPLMVMKMIAVAHPDHPLHHLGRPVSTRDLRRHRHLVVRDSGSLRNPRTTSVEVERRWTVSHMSSSIQAVSGGYGFAWLPEYRIYKEMAEGLLKPLPLREGGVRPIQLYLVLADPDFAGPGARRLIEILRASVHRECAKHMA